MESKHYKCSVCFQYYLSEETLAKHKDSFHYKCGICGSYELEYEHIEVHYDYHLERLGIRRKRTRQNPSLVAWFQNFLRLE